MEITVYPIKSMMRNDAPITELSKKFIETLKQKTGYEFTVVDNLDALKDGDLPLILVQSGGSEGKFKDEIFSNFKGPFYLLTYGSSNSLAASLEILTFVHENDKKGEILHGDDDYIANRIKELIPLYNSSKKKPVRLGILGEPSDWLISSNVDKSKAKEIFNIELIDVTEDEVIETIKRHNEKCDQEIFKAKFKQGEMDKAWQITMALEELIEKYDLQGFTLRCFDIIYATGMSACLGLAYENEKNIIATCEGDVPAMITAYSILKVLGQHAFQANPQWVNPEKNTIQLAHCTFPLDMADNYNFDTHFESARGVAIHGDMKTCECTIAKVSADLKEFFVAEGKILDNDYRNDRCRTQIEIKLDSPVGYFLKSSLGNHHQIIYGHHKKELKEYFESLGLREVC